MHVLRVRYDVSTSVFAAGVTVAVIFVSHLSSFQEEGYKDSPPIPHGRKPPLREVAGPSACSA